MSDLQNLDFERLDDNQSNKFVVLGDNNTFITEIDLSSDSMLDEDFEVQSFNELKDLHY